eukprot:1059635-Amphidinium_carterae.2
MAFASELAYDAWDAGLLMPSNARVASCKELAVSAFGLLDLQREADVEPCASSAKCPSTHTPAASECHSAKASKLPTASALPSPWEHCAGFPSPARYPSPRMSMPQTTSTFILRASDSPFPPLAMP